MAAARFLNSYIPGNERIMSTGRGGMKQAGIYGGRNGQKSCARFAKGSSAKNGKIKMAIGYHGNLGFYFSLVIK